MGPSCLHVERYGDQAEPKRYLEQDSYAVLGRRRTRPHAEREGPQILIGVIHD
jgi:hypothetical protein